jgi:UV damage endonuclease UvdE
MKIGFACQWLTSERSGKTDKEIKELEAPFRCTTTTVKFCDQNKDYEDKLWQIVKHNLLAIHKLVLKVATDKEPIKRMVRLSSDFLPMYTHPKYGKFYERTDVKNLVETSLPNIGRLVKTHGVRLSFHPDQFCVLSSENPQIVENSIREIEYHAYLVSCMGLGKEFQDFKCNVHLSGKGGINVFRKSFSKLSDVAKNILTIENDEFQAGLDYVLQVSDIVPIVLDIHHNWVNTGGYINPKSSKAKKVIDSWRGVRPVIHYSYSKPEALIKHSGDKKPNYFTLDVNDSLLRQHSDDYPNEHSNRWALSFLPDFDIMCEAKLKNLARDQLVDQYLKGL